MNALIKKPAFKIVTLILLILLTFIVSLQTGAIQIQPVDVLRTLVGLGSERDALILFEFRLPRMVIALLVGAALAVSGAILQSISQNELADPGILGINTGAGLAVVIFIYFFSRLFNRSESTFHFHYAALRFYWRGICRLFNLYICLEKKALHQFGLF